MTLKLNRVTSWNLFKILCRSAFKSTNRNISYVVIQLFCRNGFHRNGCPSQLFGRYGSYLFHTSDERVWAYANRFTGFNGYEHRVWANHGGEVYPLPINLGTINQFFRAALGPAQAAALIAEQAGEVVGEPANLEDKAISLIGRPLYEAFIRGYTAKQWQTDPRELPAAVISRLPVRLTYDNRYFADAHQGLPLVGYGEWISRMLDHPRIEVRTGVDFLTDPDVGRRAVLGRVPVVYTGAVDRWFDERFGALGWRTLDLRTEVVDVGDFQGTAVMNYSDACVPFSRSRWVIFSSPRAPSSRPWILTGLRYAAAVVTVPCRRPPSIPSC